MIGHLLNRSFEVWRPAKTADGAGGYTTTWSQIATVPARAYTTRNESQHLEAAAPGATIDVTVFVDASADVRRGDELREGETVVLRNLVTNPSFELDLAEWSSSAGTIARDTSQSYVGTASCRFDSTADGNRYVVYTSRISVTAGESYVASAYVLAGSGFTEAHIDITFYDSNGTYLGLSRDPNVVLDGWTRAVTVATAPADAVEAAFNVVFDPDTGAGTAYVDAAQMRAGTTAGDYVDGDQLGCDWDGAAHSSTTTCVREPDLLLDVVALVRPSITTAYLRVECEQRQTEGE